jgi:hypothetical protein
LRIKKQAATRKTKDSLHQSFSALHNVLELGIFNLHRFDAANWSMFQKPFRELAAAVRITRKRLCFLVPQMADRTGYLCFTLHASS